MSTQLRRNDPCHCGSGKKYKKCCLPSDEEKRHRDRSARTLQDQIAQILQIEDELSKLSNRANDLIRSGELDAAESACQQLKERFPDDIDWLERTAALCEARGDLAQALDLYQRALAFTLSPEHADGFDEEGRQWYRDKMVAVEQQLPPSD